MPILSKLQQRSQNTDMTLGVKEQSQNNNQCVKYEPQGQNIKVEFKFQAVDRFKSIDLGFLLNVKFVF